MAAMAAASLIYTAVMTHLLRTPHPYGVTLFRDGFVGSDFTVFGERSQHFGKPAYWDEFNYPFTYPAPLGVVFALFFKLPHPLAIYFMACAIGLAEWAWWLARNLTSQGIGSTDAAAFIILTLAASWPIVALFNTGNIEGLVAIILAAGVYAVLRERFWLGATLIGLAASMKLFPFILLALLISRSRWREFVWGLAVACVATIASLAALGPNILDAQRHIADGLRFINEAFILSTQRDALNYSHSLFSVLKFAVVLITRHTDAGLLNTTLRIYMLAAALAGTALYFVVIRKLPMLNQVLALTLCAVLLPPLSADYTLVELLLPFGLLCLYTAEVRGHSRALAACFGCFAALFAWETFLTVHYSFDRPIRSLALCTLLILILRTPFAWARLDRTGVAA
jgi:hypothetical protein